MQVRWGWTRGVALAALAVTLVAPGVAEAATKHAGARKAAHRAGTSEARAEREELHQAQQQIAQLQAQLNALQARIDGTAAAAPAALAQAQQAQAAAQAQSQAAEAKADKALALAAQTQNAQIKTDKVVTQAKWAADTQVSGRLFMNFSTISQNTAGARNAATGTGVNIKRAYLQVDHRFNEIFSASFVADASNVVGSSSNGNFGTTSSFSSPVGKGLFVKNAYVQANLNPALIVRLGAAPTPWIPYVENQQGYRHIENMLLDRFGYGTTADWGVHALGVLGPYLSYQVSVIDGAGFRNVKVTKSVDIEGRLAANYHGAFVAVGGYTGKLGTNVEATTATPSTYHTARRLDLAAGYKNSLFTLGGEWFEAWNWSTTTNATYNLTKPISDASRGFSAFGNVNFAKKWSVFGRYDWVEPYWHTSAKVRDHYFNVGLQFEPVRIVDLALVYKRDVADNGAVSTQNGIIGCSTTVSASCLGHGTYDEVGLFSQVRF